MHGRVARLISTVVLGPNGLKTRLLPSGRGRSRWLYSSAQMERLKTLGQLSQAATQTLTKPRALGFPNARSFPEEWTVGLSKHGRFFNMFGTKMAPLSVAIVGLLWVETRQPQRDTQAAAQYDSTLAKEENWSEIFRPSRASGPVPGADERIDHVDILLRSLLTILLSTNDARPCK